jgi:N-methylhydantoinase B
MAKTFDPITLEILWRRLVSIVDEADASVARTAFSSLLRDAHDYTCIFTDARGREIVQGTLATPGQIGAMALGVKKIVGGFSPDSLEPGDVFITNDPWRLAGHLNDVCVLSPIHHRRRLIGFTACVFHHSDIGGRVSSDCRDVFEEGLFIPLLKLYDGGKVNESVMDLIRWNVRTPESVVGDIRSQVSANYVCAQKMSEMMADTGMDDVGDLADEIVGRTEKAMRGGIEKVPDGVYRHEGLIEGPLGRPDIRIKVAVEVKGSDILVDFDGTDRQVAWGGNVVYNFTYAYVAFAMKTIFNPDLPNNEGCVRPVAMKAPEGCVVNCTFPAAVAARMQVGHFMTEMIYRALAPAIPDQVLADSGGTPAWMNVFYGQRRSGEKFHAVLIRGGGLGASHRQDGRLSSLFPANGANVPAEIFESDSPLIVAGREIITDSGGPGRQRGGVSRRIVFRVPDGEHAPQGQVAIGTQGGRFKHPAGGLFGGKAGSRSRFLIDGEDRDPGALNFAGPGAEIVFFNPGGGGYGDPLERDPDLVERDVLYGYVSVEKARDDYGVVIDPSTMKADLEATRRLRSLKSSQG